MTAFDRLPPFSISLKQMFERQVSGKAAAQPRRKEWVRTCLRADRDELEGPAHEDG